MVFRGKWIMLDDYLNFLIGRKKKKIIEISHEMRIYMAYGFGLTSFECLAIY